MGGSFTLSRQQDIVSNLVTYLMGSTEYVTDFSQGSIIRSLCEAIAQEIYLQNITFAEGISESINTSIKEVFNQPLIQPQKAYGSYIFNRSMMPSPQTLNVSESSDYSGVSFPIQNNINGTSLSISSGYLPQGSEIYYGVAGYKKRSSVTSDTFLYSNEAKAKNAIVPLDSITGNSALLRWPYIGEFEGYWVYRSTVNPETLSVNSDARPITQTVSSSPIGISTTGHYGEYFVSFVGVDSSGLISCGIYPTLVSLTNQLIFASASLVNGASTYRCYKTSVGMPLNGSLSLTIGTGGSFAASTYKYSVRAVSGYVSLTSGSSSGSASSKPSSASPLTTPIQITTTSANSSLTYTFSLINGIRYYEIFRSTSDANLTAQKISLDLNGTGGSDFTHISAFIPPIISSSSVISSEGTIGIGTFSYKFAPVFGVYKDGISVGNVLGLPSNELSVSTTSGSTNTILLQCAWATGFLTITNSIVQTKVVGYRVYKKQSNVWYYKNITISSIPTSSFSISDTGSDWVAVSGTIKEYPILSFTDTNSASFVSAAWPYSGYPMQYSEYFLGDYSVNINSQTVSVLWAANSSVTSADWPSVHKIADIDLKNLSGSSAFSFNDNSSPSKTLYMWKDNGAVPLPTSSNYYSTWPSVNTAQAVEGVLTIPDGTRVSVPNTVKIYATKGVQYMPANSNILTTNVECLQAGTVGNTSENTITYLINNVYGISSGSNPLALTSGKNLETEQEWRIRFSKTIKQLSRGTKDSLEEGAKQASIIDANGNITQQITKALAYAESSTSIKLYVHNGSTTAASSDLLSICQNIINGYYENGIIYPGYKPAGIPVTVYPCSFSTLGLNIYVTLSSGYTIAMLKTSIYNNTVNYIESIDIGDGFDIPLLTTTFTATSVTAISRQYKIVLVDQLYQKSIPSNTLEVINVGNSQSVVLQWTIPPAISAKMLETEILRWNESSGSWKKIASTSGTTNTYTDANTSIETSYSFSTNPRIVFQKSALVQKIMRVPGVVAVNIETVFGSSGEDKEIIVPGVGQVLTLGTFSLR